MKYIQYPLDKRLKRLSIICILLFIGHLQIYGQIGVITTDFLFNDKPFEEGKRLKQSLDNALIQNAILASVDRDRLGTMRDHIQLELSLRRDYSSSFNDSLNILGADYVAYGDVSLTYGSDYYRIVISFVKISGDDVFERLPITIKVDQSRIRDYEMIDSLFIDELEVFTDTYFVEGKYDKTSVPSIYKKLESQDSIITTLESEILNARKEIDDLNDQLGFIGSLSFSVQIAFDSINEIENNRRKISGLAVGILSPSLERNYTLKTGERFIGLGNEFNTIIQASNSVAVWYQIHLTNTERNLIDVTYESLSKYKGLVVQLRNFQLPNKIGYARINIAINGKTVLSNTKIPYETYVSKEGYQQFLFNLEKVVENIDNR